MLKDSALERLKKRKSAAFCRKEAAFKDFDEARARAKVARKAIDSAKAKLESCRAELNAELEAMIYAREHKKEFWEEYHHIRDRNNPEIEKLCSEANTEHTAMKESYTLAKATRALGNKAESSSHILEGRDHEERRNILNLEVSELSQEVKAAKARAKANEEAAKSNLFRQAKAKFAAARVEYQTACSHFKQCKAERERLWNEFMAAKTDYDYARSDLDGYIAGTPIL